MQIVFFGSSPFSVVVLKKLLVSHNCHVVSVVTTPDRPVGRGLKQTANPIKTLALQHNIPVKEDLTQLNSFDLPPDTLGLVAAYGKIIPSSILSKFNNHIYNIHPSLLPKYRGPSPLQQQILDGVTQTGVTIIQLDSLMDHGPIVDAQTDNISPSDNWITLGNRLFSLGTDLFLSTISSPEVMLKTQDDNLATFTKKITRQDGFLAWNEFQAQVQKPSDHIDRMLRAYTNWPGIWTINPENKRIKLISLTSPVIQIEGKSPQTWSPAV